MIMPMIGIQSGDLPGSKQFAGNGKTGTTDTAVPLK
jgi:hypothetical protein